LSARKISHTQILCSKFEICVSLLWIFILTLPSVVVILLPESKAWFFRESAKKGE